MCTVEACEKCGGSGWVWFDELDNYDGPANEGSPDDTRYTCDWCGGYGKLIMEY